MFLKKAYKSGQATVEYLLLAVVIIVIARVILSPLGTGLTQYSQFLLGPYNEEQAGYYGCLMENGLLPGLSPGFKAGGEVLVHCNQKALAIAAINANLSAGGFNERAKSFGVTTNSGGSSGDGSSSSSDSSSDASSDSSSGSGSSDSNSSKSKKSSSGKNSSSSKNNKNSSSGSGGDDDSDDSSGLSNNESGSAASPSNPALFKLAGNSSKSKKRRKKKKKRRRFRPNNVGDEYSTSKQNKNRTKSKIAVDSGYGEGYLGYAVDENQEDERPPVFQASASAKKQGGFGDAKTNNSRLLVERGPSGGESQDKIEPFNFNNFIKYAIIGAVIIILLSIVFSQMMEFQRQE